MNNPEHITENATSKDFFKFLGALITLAFGALFFFLKLLGSSNSANESEGLFEIDEEDYNDLTSTSSSALTNPMNLHND
ncbi:hypothetical protein [uncultured Cocleimonas sp.]|uniref:hypothetical protein n=1 Tax=uncultured Cocleimonas sp. TaxID=1051587 RepID=UPI002620C73D|nr:hypothetical protein [uncultured Cocleimonas sp.]